MEPTARELGALERRVAGLERQNRWVRRAGYAILLLLASALLMGLTKQPQTARANNFSLLDSKGNVEAELKIGSDGKPSLSFYDQKHKANVILTGGDSPMLSFYDDKQEPNMVLAGGGSPGLELGIATNGQASVNLSAANHSLILLDAQGKPQVTLAAFEDGAGLRIEDAHGYSAVLGTEDLITPRTGQKQTTSAASLVLFGKDKKVLWSAP